jgi:type VI secretion system protein ImpF
VTRSTNKLLPRLSLFDRLLQGDSLETDRNADRAWRELRDSVRRDLEILFTTRPRYLSIAPKLEELRSSILTFGMQDIQTQQLATSSQLEQFRFMLESLIRKFEPRFRDVSIELLTTTDTLDRTLRFRIHAILQTNATSEPVTYDTAVEPVSGRLMLVADSSWARPKSGDQ